LRTDSWIGVERRERGDVDDFRADAFRGECVGGFERFLDLRAPGDERDVAAVAQHEADVERQRSPSSGTSSLYWR
jgi:hypothetical protein